MESWGSFLSTSPTSPPLLHHLSWTGCILTTDKDFCFSMFFLTKTPKTTCTSCFFCVFWCLTQLAWNFYPLKEASKQLHRIIWGPSIFTPHAHMSHLTVQRGQYITLFLAFTLLCLYEMQARSHRTGRLDRDNFIIFKPNPVCILQNYYGIFAQFAAFRWKFCGCVF